MFYVTVRETGPIIKHIITDILITIRRFCIEIRRAMASEGEQELASIDVSPLLSSRVSSKSREAVIEALRHSCTTDGFFQITGHGIPVELQRHVLECTRTYFELPMEQKRTISVTKALGMAYRGYEELNGQAIEVGGLPDLKEVNLVSLVARD
jgi:isopenicillin N synthase-like dioxygenase